MNISALLVKELREKTGAGMMDCKKALEESEADLEKAVDWLRQKGLSKAAKKAGRATSEGLIGFEVSETAKSAVLIEVKCETDFVARGDKFQDFVKSMVAQVKADCPKDEASLLTAKAVSDTSRTVQDLLNDAIATIGENIVLGKFEKMDLTAGNCGRFGSYLHSNGKIAVLVELKCASEKVATNGEFADLAKNLAMQIAAANPLAIAPESLDPAILDRERDVYRQKAREEGKPAEIVEKIAEGAVKKYYKEVCLLEQGYIRDDKMPVGDLIKAASKSLGEPISVVRFSRVQLGAE